MKRKIVYKIEEGIDPSEVYCTTYQMRNFYKQFRDGFYSSLDVMNFIQHHKAVTLMRKGDRVLDVCCGRGLLLPLIRYYRSNIAEYVGIDISQKNIDEQKRWSGAKKIEGNFRDYYPFKITHVVKSVEDMGDFFDPNSFNMIIYTSSIEHMQKEAGEKSLKACYDILKSEGLLFLSCPNTREKKDPYDTQYAAHLYEWDLDELSDKLLEIGFEIKDTFGLVGKVREFNDFMIDRPEAEQEIYKRMREYFPATWLMAIFPVLYPWVASEVLILATKHKSKRRMRRFVE